MSPDPDLTEILYFAFSDSPSTFLPELVTVTSLLPVL